MSLEDLLERNRAWAARERARDPEYFSRHVTEQRPHLLWIGCSDSRVPAEQVTACCPGEIFVHRNIANVVSYNDVNISAVVQYAVGHLHIPDIVVCGHYGCGGVKAACDEKVVGGYIGDWLMITAWAKRFVEERLRREGGEPPDHATFLRLVVEENVRLQIQHLSNLSVVREQWDRSPGVPRLHGWCYDIGTGLIQVIEDHAGSSTTAAGEV
ncbi:MAG: carbonic anhydrase [Candidatus Riflebacteria bacterium]|nr:carbonic anhydrase [Candidatus Riflebacteria bacterium]